MSKRVITAHTPPFDTVDPIDSAEQRLGQGRIHIHRERSKKD